MLEKDVIGFGWLLARSSARPQIVLLLPQVRTILLLLFLQSNYGADEYFVEIGRKYRSTWKNRQT